MSTNYRGSRANVVRLNNIRVAPRKLRILVDLIRNKDVEQALVLLQYSERGPARDLAKLIASGVANVRTTMRDWDVDSLYVARAWVDGGPVLKRFKPRAQGRATPVLKRTSCVTIELLPDTAGTSED